MWEYFKISCDICIHLLIWLSMMNSIIEFFHRLCISINQDFCKIFIGTLSGKYIYDPQIQWLLMRKIKRRNIWLIFIRFYNPCRNLIWVFAIIIIVGSSSTIISHGTPQSCIKWRKILIFSRKCWLSRNKRHFTIFKSIEILKWSFPATSLIIFNILSSKAFYCNNKMY